MPRTKKTDSIFKVSTDENKFPYETFPYRLETKEGKSKRVCWFSHESHVHKYIERHKLASKDYIAECFDIL